MRWVQNLLMVVAVASLASCVENEKSFYIEHAKVAPDFPDCSVSSGDDVAPMYSLNLFNAWSPGTFFYVTNAIMSQEDYGTLKLQSNGIIIDGYELYTLIPGEGAVGGTEYFEYNHYIEPESSDILYASLMSPTTLETLQAHFQCNPATQAEIANGVYNGDMDLLNTLNQGGDTASVMFAVVRFMGHTQGGKNVQTQEFSIQLNTYCGMSGGWEPCFADRCYAFCESGAVFQEACNSGVNQVMTCADYLSGITIYEDDPANPGTSVDFCTLNCGG